MEVEPDGVTLSNFELELVGDATDQDPIDAILRDPNPGTQLEICGNDALKFTTKCPTGDAIIINIRLMVSLVSEVRVILEKSVGGPEVLTVSFMGLLFVYSMLSTLDLLDILHCFIMQHYSICCQLIKHWNKQHDSHGIDFGYRKLISPMDQVILQPWLSSRDRSLML